MDIPIRIADKLWEDCPDALDEFTGWTHVHCDTSWDEVGSLILDPVSLCDQTTEESVAVQCPLRIKVDLASITAEYDGLLGECLEKVEDKFMEKCVERAEGILNKRCDILDEKETIFLATSMAIVFFQSRVDQVIAAREKGNSKISGNTGLRG